MFLEGKHIYLREVRRSDISIFSEYYNWMNDPEATKYVEFRFRPQTTDDLTSYIEEHNSNPSLWLFAIILKSDMTPETHIGNIKLGPVNWIHRYAEISLVIGKKFWGKGYGTEAIKLVSDFAFNILGLHKLTAGAYTENIASIKAFQKVGFETEGEIKEMYYSNGKRTGRILLGRINNAVLY